MCPGAGRAARGVAHAEKGISAGPRHPTRAVTRRMSPLSPPIGVSGEMSLPEGAELVNTSHVDRRFARHTPVACPLRSKRHEQTPPRPPRRVPAPATRRGAAGGSSSAGASWSCSASPSGSASSACWSPPPRRPAPRSSGATGYGIPARTLRAPPITRDDGSASIGLPDRPPVDHVARAGDLRPGGRGFRRLRRGGSTWRDPGAERPMR